MKLLLFTSVRAVHSKKWLASLATEFDLHVACFSAPQLDRIEGVTYHELLSGTQPALAKESDAAGGGVKISKEAWLTFKNGIKFAKRFAQIIEQVQPDVIHAHQSVPFGWYAVRARSASDFVAPLVVSVWGTDVMAYPEQHWLFKLMNYIVLKRATALTATSKALVAAARRWSKRTDWLVIPFGVDPLVFVKKSAVAARATTFGMAKQLRFVGDIDVYGLQTAIKALAIARKTTHELTLEIAGDGPQAEFLRWLAQKNGVTDAVTFLGTKPPQELGKIMAGWDALLLPSTQESFGVVAVEAAAVGIPVLGSDVGGIPEIVVENVTGRLFSQLTPEKLAAAMLSLDERLLKSAYEHGPKLVAERFTWQASVERMKKVYEALS